MNERVSTIDWKTISRGTWLAIVGGALLLIAPFLDWYNVSVDGDTLGISSVSIGGSGWDTTDLAKLVVLIALVVLALVAVELFAPTVKLPVAPALALLGLGGLAALIVLIRIIDVPGDTSDVPGIDIGRSFGLFLALIASALVIAGGYLRLREAEAPRP